MSTKHIDDHTVDVGVGDCSVAVAAVRKVVEWGGAKRDRWNDARDGVGPLQLALSVCYGDDWACSVGAVVPRTRRGRARSSSD